MYIVEVTPFSNSIRTDSLSYFSSQKIELGSIVTVPLRNKNIKGLVIDIKDVKNMKSELKDSSYALKKIKGVSKNSLLSAAFIESAKETANYFATSTGSIIQSIIPQIIFDDSSKFLIKTEKLEKLAETESPKYILQSEENDRYSEYKSIIREKFAKGQSVFFCAPTIEDVKYAEDKLTRGIEKHAFTLHNRKTKKQISETWNEVTSRKKPTLVIATPVFVSIPLKNTGIIIVERESSSAYKTFKRPNFDTKFFIEKYAKNMKADFMVGDLMLKTETLARYDNHEFFEYTPIKFRSITDATQKIIDLKDPSKTIKNNIFISKALAQMIDKALLNNEKTFLLNSRRGMAPIIVCGDCGQMVKCEKCDSSIVLHGKDATNEDNYFKCHSCGDIRHAGEKCKNCDSWKLVTLGYGTEKIGEEISKIFPDSKVFILDKDHAKTPKQAEKIIEGFYESANGILIGTEMSLLYLKNPVENVAVTSIDSMFSLPDFRIRERILNILLKARSKTTQAFMIQTRNIEDPIFKNATEGNLMDFYRKEFIDRKKFNYPPFSLIIKFSLVGKSISDLEDNFQTVQDLFEDHNLITYPAFIQNVRGNKIMNGIIRLDRKEWPNAEMIEKIKTLPPKFKVEIDAESVL